MTTFNDDSQQTRIEMTNKVYTSFSSRSIRVETIMLMMFRDKFLSFVVRSITCLVVAKCSRNYREDIHFRHKLYGFLTVSEYIIILHFAPRE